MHIKFLRENLLERIRREFIINGNQRIQRNAIPF